MGGHFGRGVWSGRRKNLNHGAQGCTKAAVKAEGYELRATSCERKDVGVCSWLVAHSPIGHRYLERLKFASEKLHREAQFLTITNELLNLSFQRFARPCKYFRTVSSTLVTPIRVTGAQFGC